MAMRLGTNSPSTSVKYDRIKVMTITEMVLSALAEMLWKPTVLTSQLVKRLAKLSAANAEPKNPASVMPTCIVERKVVGCSMIFNSFAACLLPSSDCLRTLFSLSESTAISVAAKKALSRMSAA